MLRLCSVCAPSVLRLCSVCAPSVLRRSPSVGDRGDGTEMNDRSDGRQVSTNPLQSSSGRLERLPFEAADYCPRTPAHQSQCAETTEIQKSGHAQIYLLRVRCEKHNRPHTSLRCAQFPRKNSKLSFRTFSTVKLKIKFP